MGWFEVMSDSADDDEARDGVHRTLEPHNHTVHRRTPCTHAHTHTQALESGVRSYIIPHSPPRQGLDGDALYDPEICHDIT